MNDNQLYGVDPGSAELTAVGDGQGAPSEDSSCASQGAQLPGTDWFYFVDWDATDSLDRVNLVTGEHQEIGEITVNGAPENITYSLTIGPDGTAYILDYDDLYTVDLETGAATYLSSPNFYDEYSGYPYAFAYDYKTEKFYVVEDGDGAMYELDPATGNKVEMDYNEDYWVASMAFDSEGDLWINGDNNGASTVALADFGDSNLWIDTDTFSPSVYSESIWVSGPRAADELAETGFSPAPLFAGAALATAAGVAIVRSRRRA